MDELQLAAPVYRMFTDVFSRFIIRDTLVDSPTRSASGRTTGSSQPVSAEPKSSGRPGALKYAATTAEELVSQPCSASAPKKVQFREDEKEKPEVYYINFWDWELNLFLTENWIYMKSPKLGSLNWMSGFFCTVYCFKGFLHGSFVLICNQLWQRWWQLKQLKSVNNNRI